MHEFSAQHSKTFQFFFQFKCWENLFDLYMCTLTRTHYNVYIYIIRGNYLVALKTCECIAHDSVGKPNHEICFTRSKLLHSSVLSKYGCMDTNIHGTVESLPQIYHRRRCYAGSLDKIYDRVDKLNSLLSGKSGPGASVSCEFL